MLTSNNIKNKKYLKIKTLGKTSVILELPGAFKIFNISILNCDNHHVKPSVNFLKFSILNILTLLLLEIGGY